MTLYRSWREILLLVTLSVIAMLVFGPFVYYSDNTLQNKRSSLITSVPHGKEIAVYPFVSFLVGRVRIISTYVQCGFVLPAALPLIQLLKFEIVKSYSNKNKLQVVINEYIF